MGIYIGAGPLSVLMYLGAGLLNRGIFLFRYKKNQK